MPKIHFTSDTHFSQERTFKYSMRNMYFSSVEEMDRVMVDNWNSVVSSEDIVFHLGDFGIWDMVKYLNGYITLLEGNYEREGKNGALTPENERYFASIMSSSFIKLRTGRIVLVHEPHHIENLGGNIYPNNPEFYLFGHIHEKQKVKRNGLNVGVDVHNFTPISWDTVNFYREAVKNIYDADCFENFEFGGDLWESI